MRQHIAPHVLRLHVLERRVHAAPEHDVADQGQGQHAGARTMPAPPSPDSWGRVFDKPGYLAGWELGVSAGADSIGAGAVPGAGSAMGAGSEGVACGAGASGAGISGAGASSFFWQPASARASNAATRTDCLISCFMSLLLTKMVACLKGPRAVRPSTRTGTGPASAAPLPQTRTWVDRLLSWRGICRIRPGLPVRRH